MSSKKSQAEKTKSATQMVRSSLLFVHPGSLGDNILALAALRGLHERFHFSRRIFVGERQIGHLLQHCREVDVAYPLEHALWTDCLLPHEMWSTSTKRIMDSVSHAVVWMNDADGTVTAMLERAGIPWISVRSPNNTELNQEHQEDRFLEILGDWDVRRPSWKPLRLLHPLQVAVSPLVVIHPGSGSPHKCLPPPVWVEAIRRLIRDEPWWNIALIGGPADDDHLLPLRRALEDQPIQIFHNSDLVTIAGLLASADMFWGHDSGPTHLAAALGTPTLAVFGPTSPARWAPRGACVTVINNAACQCQTWDAVRACDAKPCLMIDPDHIVHESQALRRTVRVSHYPQVRTQTNHVMVS